MVKLFFIAYLCMIIQVTHNFILFVYTMMHLKRDVVCFIFFYITFHLKYTKIYLHFVYLFAQPSLEIYKKQYFVIYLHHDVTKPYCYKLMYNLIHVKYDKTYSVFFVFIHASWFTWNTLLLYLFYINIFVK